MNRDVWAFFQRSCQFIRLHEHKLLNDLQNNCLTEKAPMMAGLISTENI